MPKADRVWIVGPKWASSAREPGGGSNGDRSDIEQLSYGR